MKKIGALVSVYNHELFIGAHLKMLSKYADKIIVIFQEESNPQYVREHGVSRIKDKTEDIVNTLKFETRTTKLTSADFSQLNNECREHFLDCDIVLRLDPDVFFTNADFKKFIDFIQTHDFDYYRLNFKTNSINYYVINRFDLGLKDALEPKEIIAFNPHKPYTLSDADNQFLIPWQEFMMHHFRGWKPSSTETAIKEFSLNHSEYGEFITAPDEIINYFK